MIINQTAFSDSEIKLLVEKCENNFECELSRAATCIHESNAKIITLAGPTCSGKTTAADKLVSLLSGFGKKANIISIDNYYFDRDYLKSISENGKIDFDSPKTIDLAFLERTVDEIDSSHKLHIPYFDFKVGKRVGITEIYPSPNDVYIFEGIQAVYPEVTSLFKHVGCENIFISVSEDLCIANTNFNKRDIRFFRRLVRDHRTRNATPEFTFSLWKSVCENEDVHIVPYSSESSIKLNSLLGYEPYVIKPYLIPLLEEISEDSPFYTKSREIIRAFENIKPISKNYVPTDSLFREFIGQ